MYPLLMWGVPALFGILAGTFLTLPAILVVSALCGIAMVVGLAILSNRNLELAALVGIFPLVISVGILVPMWIAFYISTGQTFVQDFFIGLRADVIR
ncbi:MAG TPA: hypothetical protein VEB18_01250 [Candidatus Paceibacterota bacterium]|nr:hypothetical protein [Candidatus Paceibacterota bacterium]